MRIRRISSRKFMLIIISRKRKNLYKVISYAKAKLETEIIYQNNMYKAICYGQRSNSIYQIINSTQVPQDTWVYEYHEKDAFIYNNYEYRQLDSINLQVIVDVIYRTGPLSLEDSIRFILKKRILYHDEEKYLKLLLIENSKLYKSIIRKLIDDYQKQELLNTIYVNQIDRIYRQIAHILLDIGDYHYLFSDLKHLSYEQFIYLVKEV